MLPVIENNFWKDLLIRLCGVAADGPYQAAGFKKELYLKLDVQHDLAMPISWDPSHLLNLAVADIRDSTSYSGRFFRLFIKRCNVFYHVLAYGKGFAFLPMIDDQSMRPVSYATQRLASSAYDQWIKIEKSFSSYWKAFEMLHPNRNANKEWQYMICGSDFDQDLLSLLDISTL